MQLPWRVNPTMAEDTVIEIPSTAGHPSSLVCGFITVAVLCIWTALLASYPVRQTTKAGG